ncbi:MAG: hypothetical protein AAFR59_15670, partial [Bacteroidota bacterium]
FHLIYLIKNYLITSIRRIHFNPDGHLATMTESEIQYFMKEAILEGRKAIPKCAPNPPVG